LEAPDSLVEKYEIKLKKYPVQKSAVYAAMVENMDYNVGRLLKELQRLQLEKNTIVIFFSDNGGTQKATNNAPLREGKGFLYEGGIRVPLIIKWPGQIQENSHCNYPVISDDLYPTVMEMIGQGVAPNKSMDGISLLPLLLGKQELKRDKLCWYYPHYSPQSKMPGYAIRKGDYKLIEHFDPPGVELYNLQNDLSETKDLSEINPDKVKELKTDFNKWLKQMDPVLHTINPDFKPKTKQ
jgi:arylsulfatase A-like enzyme